MPLRAFSLLSHSRSLLVFAIFALCASLTALRAAAPADPATSDPVSVDLAHPPRMESLKITSGDAKLNALLYLAGGAGRHPVVVMFHGYPGNEKNLDLAQAIRRAGWHVLWFNYRGSWGSGGTFSMAHALEDAHNALTFVRSPAAVEKYGFDTRRIAVVGHSFGGWLALMTGARDPQIGAIVSLAGWNPVVDIAATENDPQKKAATIKSLDEFDAGAGPLRGDGPARLYDEISRLRADYDYFRKAADLRTRPLLIIAATRDVDQPLPTYHDPLVKALADVRAPRVEALLYEDDHPFSAHRIALARKVTQWLNAALPPQ
jgi:pimeloyl-ACP methyl ester carboxylesterase